MRLALFQPEIPQNVGATMRLCACWGLPLEVILPTGFPFSSAAVRRAAMDYAAAAENIERDSWSAYREARAEDGARTVLLTTSPEARPLYDYAFTADDVLMLGMESAGAPPEVHAAADARLRIPMRAGMRSLNMAMAAAIAVSEALRQTTGFEGMR